MLNEEVIDKVVERLVYRIEEINTYTLEQIGKSIKRIGTLSPSKAQELGQILKYGGDYDKIAKKLSQITRLNIQDIYTIFDEVAQNDYRFAKQFYDYRGVKYIPYEENIVLQNQVNALTRMMIDDYITRTGVIGFSVKDLNGNLVFKDLNNVYRDTIDKAVLSVSQGKSTFQDEMYRIINELGSSGLKTVKYASGRTMRLDSAVRMDLKRNLRDLHFELQTQFGEEFGADGYEVSVHMNPAPDHEEAQGRQFSKEEYSKLQSVGVAKDYKGKNIDITTISKSGVFHRPIREYNCYHYEFPIVLGVSKPEYSDEELQQIRDDNNKGFELDGKHYTNYQGTQLQRTLERKIREQKDIQIMAKAGDITDLVDKSQGNITKLTNKYKELSKVSGLPTKMQRMRVSGYKRSKVDLKRYYEDNLIGLSNDRFTINGVSQHIIDKKWERNLHLKDLQRTFTSPLDYGKITYDKQGRPSVKIIGENVTAYINPDTGVLTTWHRTHSKTRKKYEGK